jgi:hypothetical protein
MVHCAYINFVRKSFKLGGSQIEGDNVWRWHGMAWWSMVWHGTAMSMALWAFVTTLLCPGCWACWCGCLHVVLLSRFDHQNSQSSGLWGAQLSFRNPGSEYVCGHISYQFLGRQLWTFPTRDLLLWGRALGSKTVEFVCLKVVLGRLETLGLPNCSDQIYLFFRQISGLAMGWCRKGNTNGTS